MKARVAACLALALFAGCGSSGGSSRSGSSSTVQVQDTAGVPAAFLEYGVSRGYFKKHNLNVKVKPSQGGATVVPAVLSGSVDIGGSNLVSILLARSKNIPVKVIAPGTFVQRTRDFSAIIVKGDSPIRSPKDLEGKTLAVNTLKNVAELTARASLAKQGVDVSKVKLTEVDFPDMIAAVNKGRVDAAFPIEPFVSLSQKAGDRIIERPYLSTKPGLQIGCYFTSQKYLAKNGDVVKRFQQGVADTAASITKDPKAFRDFLPKGSSIPPAAAQKVVLPQWKAKSDPASIALTQHLMTKYGVAK
jgi:NitT/TauT family transport system substrate-binding protein